MVIKRTSTMMVNKFVFPSRFYAFPGRYLVVFKLLPSVF